MQLPQKYPYSPSFGRLFLGVLFFGGGSFFFHYLAGHPREGLAVFAAALGDTGAGVIYDLLAVLSAAMALMAAAVGVRSCFVRESLELRSDALVMPRGFFRSGTVSHPYTSIHHLEEKIYSGRARLLVGRTEAGRFSISATVLPDQRTYEEIRDFLTAKCAANAVQPPFL